MLRTYFSITMMLILVGILLPTPDVLFVPNLDASAAYAYIFLCVVLFYAGHWAMSAVKFGGKSTPAPLSAGDAVIDRWSLCLLLLLALIGVAILIAQISATLGLPLYFAMIFSSSSSDQTTNLRYQTVAMSASEGGYPGLIKMFNWLSVISPFCLLSLFARGHRVRGLVGYLLVSGIFFAFLAGTFLRQDRLSMLSLIPVSISMAYRLFKRTGNRRAKIVAGLVSLFLVFAIVLQSSRRGSEWGPLEWVALYVQVGTENLALMMRSVFDHTYGFSGPLAPLAIMGRILKLDLGAHGDTLLWVWGDVDNAFGYAFLDFGWMSALYFLFGGVCAGYLDARISRSKEMNPYSTTWEKYWICAYAVLSLPFIPSYNGIEFWLMLGTVPLLMRYLLGRQKVDISLPEKRVRGWVLKLHQPGRP